MSIARDRKELGLIEDHIESLLKTGQSYSEAESHTLTMVDMERLQTRETYLRRRILRGKGFCGRIG